MRIFPVAVNLGNTFKYTGDNGLHMENSWSKSSVGSRLLEIAPDLWR